MSNSIDIGAIALGMAVGYGLREEIRSSAGVCKSALLAAATVAAATTAAAVEGAKATQAKQSPEEVAAEAWNQRMDQQISQSVGQAGQGQNGH